MQTNLPGRDLLLRKEADALLFDKGLHDVLLSFGTPHYTGSYALQLMTWRDLDIYLETDRPALPRFFELGRQVAALLNPVKMSFRNELLARTEGLPKGLYWGVYLGNERNGAWKIDIWAMDAEECRSRLAYCNQLAGSISPTDKESILAIKSHCWRDPAYRKAYTSSDIYEAVLNHGVADIDGFKAYLARGRG